MIKRSVSLLSFLVPVLLSYSQHSVRFVISALPLTNSNNSNLFVAGSFNGWNPQDKNYHFQKNEQGSYSLGIKLADGAYEFKITRGGWDKVECKKGGVNIQNRFLRLSSDTTIDLVVEEWADNIEGKPKVSTAGKNVHMIDTAFLIPQLNRTRRVWIYLPSDYSATKKHYPVLYMQDGQNVFDDVTSFAGEWSVDETMDSIGNHTREMIVVAVDHGGDKRINEYCPYDMEKYGKGEGNKYVDFLVKTLKPFIDKSYRTEKNKKNTFIAGSSMGGLISLYAVLKYPQVFGGAGIFSPAFWTASGIDSTVIANSKKVNSRLFFYAGGKEGDSMVPDMKRIEKEIKERSSSPIEEKIDEDAKHNEAAWRKFFPDFYEWTIEGNKN